MNENALNKTFDPQTMADDLLEVRRLYAQFFAGLRKEGWDKPVKGGSKEWTLHEAVAHLVALNGAGLESVQRALQGESYTFIGLDSRYKFNAYNRKGIDDHLGLSMNEVSADLLDILSQAASVAHNLTPDLADTTVQLPIYNRPVKIVEALSIIMIHTGLFHSAQVAEPAGLPPLWIQLPPEIRHRTGGRTMRAFSLLYRLDIGGSLRATLVFRIDGPGGGEWFVKLSPDAPTSGEGHVDHPGLVIHLRKTDVFCQMLTSRLNLPKALISGAMKLRGDLRLYLRMGTLFSVDARPPIATNTRKSSTPQYLTGK